MYMRGRFFIISLLLAIVIVLTSCVTVVNGPADELRMYSWHAERENGDIVTLRFNDGKAALYADNGDFPLCLSGLCIITDNTLTICDEATKTNYTFGYTLYGDRVELSCNNSVLTLQKADESYK